MKKKCFKCEKIKDIESFYLHKEMADGHLNKCKSCAKKDVKTRYFSPEAREKIVLYEKLRFQKPERKKKVLEYQIQRRKKFVGKYKARQKVGNALRNGTLVKSPCFCGNKKVEAHHEDYRSPLKVVWLCREHHLGLEGKISYSIK